jgi:hypothetical protein
METSLIIIIMGPAGSGKTTLANTLGKWILMNEGLSVAYVNLDPAVEYLPYIADYDIRTLVNARHIMTKENLGPNGAIIRAIDIMALRKKEILEKLTRLKSDIIIVDTPGQSESFLFRRAGPEIVMMLKELAPTVGIYLADPTLGLTASESAIALLMSLIIQLRLDIQTVPVINKVDLMTEIITQTYHMELNRIKELILKEKQGLLSELIMSLVDVIADYVQSVRVVALSALTGEGVDELYKIIHETFCVCGDLS